VHRHRCPRSLTDRRLGGVRVHPVVVRGDVDGDRNSPDLGDGLPRRDERHRGDEHLVADPDAECFERETQPVEPARKTDAMVDAAKSGERGLELADRRPVHECGGIQGVRHVSEHVVADPLEAPSELEERNGAR
jgi:hypothetical protein